MAGKITKQELHTTLVSEIEGGAMIQQPTPPSGVKEGRIWLDLSDNEFQGTVLDGVEEHLNSQVAHGIGNRTILKTTDKSTIVAAINELFTSASNGKTAIKGAVTGVDPQVVIPENPTFEQLVEAIAKIKTGKKFARGTASASTLITVTGLDFQPSVIIIGLNNNLISTGVMYNAYVSVSQYWSGVNRTASINGTNMVYHGGFRLTTDSSVNTWIAYE